MSNDVVDFIEALRVRVAIRRERMRRGNPRPDALDIVDHTIRQEMAKLSRLHDRMAGDGKDDDCRTIRQLMYERLPDLARELRWRKY